MGDEELVSREKRAPDQELEATTKDERGRERDPG